MKRMRGFVMPAIGYVLILIALLAMLMWVFHWVDDHWETAAGVKKGGADKQAEWDKANREAQDKETRFRQTAGAAMLRLDENRTLAEHRAQLAEANYQEERRARQLDRKGRPLAVCAPAGSTKPALAGSGGKPGELGSGQADVVSGGAAGPAGVLLTADFVREFDGGWTGVDGQPVQRPVDGDPGAAGAGAAWRTPEDTIDVAAENARRCSADRRDLDSLKARVAAKREAWDKAHR